MNFDPLLSRFAPGADFIGAGDEVAIIVDGRIEATGIVVDIADDGRVIVNAESEDSPGNGWTDAYPLDALAHVDSPAAADAAGTSELARAYVSAKTLADGEAVDAANVLLAAVSHHLYLTTGVCPDCGGNDVACWGETPERTDADITDHMECQFCGWTWSA